jgi:hypothetical protein
VVYSAKLLTVAWRRVLHPARSGRAKGAVPQRITQKALFHQSAQALSGQTVAAMPGNARSSRLLSSALWVGARAMMTKGEFLNRFQRQPDGAWCCTKPIKVEGPSGPFTIRQGVIFNPGALLLGLDLAKELDRMAAEERIARNPALRQS